MTTTAVRPSAPLLAAACAAALILTGCSSSSSSPDSGGSSPSATAASGGGTTIVIRNFAFTPAGLTVAPGTKVTVLNKDSTAHTATAAKGDTFDTGTIAPGKSATFTAPRTKGVYDYICTIHQFMKAKLTVS
ncbi:Plastocyanin [Actinacidiphila alni]|uniref:Plastocyanin n=1 Tax=Actinacidiphila alni TaxID=380248 RepID=A0A1I1ZII6_9ACTN|nr:cupredoxin domain-containing protein [Actinacidiphila alni]SFE31507.1 Plastocyanin [Actinacidiphila alni]